MGIDEEIAEAVHTHGWQFISISDVDPPFLYSIGFMPTHPEAIVFGLEPKAATQVMSEIATRIQANEKFEDKAAYGVEASLKNIAVRTVHPTQIELYFGYAMGYCRLKQFGDVQAVQIFWPDRKGIFPFEVGCDQATYSRQPRLDIGLSPEEIEEWERQWE